LSRLAKLTKYEGLTRRNAGVREKTNIRASKDWAGI
jgi:hypothetical protein